MIVPYNDPNLLSEAGNAAESPYVIAMTRAGIKVLPPNRARLDIIQCSLSDESRG